jgi:hypothetical protein
MVVWGCPECSQARRIAELQRGELTEVSNGEGRKATAGVCKSSQGVPVGDAFLTFLNPSRRQKFRRPKGKSPPPPSEKGIVVGATVVRRSGAEHNPPPIPGPREGTTQTLKPCRAPRRNQGPRTRRPRHASLGNGHTCRTDYNFCGVWFARLSPVGRPHGAEDTHRRQVGKSIGLPVADPRLKGLAQRADQSTKVGRT